jgi:hypothetical protein
MCRVSAKILSIYNFAWGLLKATKKVYLIPQKWKKKTKIHMGSGIWDLSDKVCKLNPKTSKNYQNTKSTNHDENFFKKSMFSTLKRKGAKNSYKDYPTELAVILKPSNQPIKTKIFPKKICFVP